MPANAIPTIKASILLCGLEAADAGPIQVRARVSIFRRCDIELPRTWYPDPVGFDR